MIDILLKAKKKWKKYQVRYIASFAASIVAQNNWVLKINSNIMDAIWKTVNCLSLQIGAVILSPGRELSRQVASVATKLLTGTQLRVISFVGGTRAQDDIANFKANG